MRVSSHDLLAHGDPHPAPPLDLPPGVRTDLRAFFAGTVDPTAVTIRRGHVPGIPHPRAFALPGLIYLGADPGVVGIAGLEILVRLVIFEVPSGEVLRGILVVEIADGSRRNGALNSSVHLHTNNKLAPGIN